MIVPAPDATIGDTFFRCAEAFGANAFLADTVQEQALGLRRGPEALDKATAVRLISPQPGTAPRELRTQDSCVVQR